jgi:polar amino acid transport system substrate-binding protein
MSMPAAPPTRRQLLAAAGLWLGCPTARAAISPLQLLSYYDYPPFVTGPGLGLSHDLAQWLRQRVGPVAMDVLPRRRVDALTASPGWSGIVPWVAPSWFPGSSRQARVWSEPLMDDEDLVLSRKAKPVAFDNIQSLQGLTLGGVFGHLYRDADPLVQRGVLRRLDSFTQEANLRMLMLGRVDAIFLSRSGLGWWRHRITDFDQQIEIAAQPRMRYQRHLMLSGQLPAALRQALLEAVPQLRASPEWREMLQRYEIKTAEQDRWHPHPRSLA